MKIHSGPILCASVCCLFFPAIILAAGNNYQGTDNLPHWQTPEFNNQWGLEAINAQYAYAADIMDTGSTLVYWTQSYFSTLSLTANFHSFPAIYLMILKPKTTVVFLSKVTECMLLALLQPGGTAPECTAWHLVRHSPQAIFRTVIMFWNSWPQIMSG